MAVLYNISFQKKRISIIFNYLGNRKYSIDSSFPVTANG